MAQFFGNGGETKQLQQQVADLQADVVGLQAAVRQLVGCLLEAAPLGRGYFSNAYGDLAKALQPFAPDPHP